MAINPKKVNPRKPPAKTSRVVSGTAKPGALGELGINSIIGIPDVVPQFRNLTQRLRLYSQMVDNDATINATLNAVKAPVIGGEYYIEPASSDQLDKDIAEFVEFNLFEAQSVTWLQFLEEILTAAEFGFSVFEKVWEDREWTPRRSMANAGIYTMLQKMAFRPQTTIQKFLYDDNGGPKGVTHLLQNPNKPSGGNNVKDIDIDKLIIFTNKKRGGNLEGKSVLRTAYKHWYYKEGLYKIDAIQKERHGIGVPEVTLPVGHTTADETRAEELVRNLRTNEYAYIVKPFGFEVGFAELSGNPVDVMKSAEHHDLLIAKNVLVQFINMGQGDGGGSRATAGTQMDFLLKAIRHTADKVCEALNLYLIPQLVGYNFSTTRFPHIKVRSIGESRDLQMVSAALANLAGGNLITPTVELERWLLGTLFDAPTAAIDDPGFKQAFEVQNTIKKAQAVAPAVNAPGAPAQGTPPVDNNPTNQGQVKPGAVKTGNIGKPTGAAQ